MSAMFCSGQHFMPVSPTSPLSFQFKTLRNRKTRKCLGSLGSHQLNAHRCLMKQRFSPSSPIKIFCQMSARKSCWPRPNSRSAKAGMSKLQKQQCKPQVPWTPTACWSTPRATTITQCFVLPRWQLQFNFPKVSRRTFSRLCFNRTYEHVLKTALKTYT